MVDRRLNVGLVALVPGRVKNSIVLASEARDEVEDALGGEFFANTPFKQLSLIIRFGAETNLDPEIGVPKRGELPIAIQLEMAKLRRASESEVRAEFSAAIVHAVLDVARRFGAPNEGLLRLRAKQAAGVSGFQSGLTTPLD